MNVIVTNGCMNITKDLPFYIIECNYEECINKELSLYYIERNCHERFYKYYEISIIVLY